jgi:hypothetical protein
VIFHSSELCTTLVKIAVSDNSEPDHFISWRCPHQNREYNFRRENPNGETKEGDPGNCKNDIPQTALAVITNFFRPQKAHIARGC